MDRNNLSLCKYSIVIVSFNCREVLQRCLNSVLKHSQNAEVIVVDNNSTDGTRELLKEFHGIKSIYNKSNSGFSSGCNTGASVACGEYFIFLNPDTVVTSNWLESMEAHFSTPAVGAVGPLSNYVAGLQKIEHYYPLNPKEPIAIDTLSKQVAQLNRGKGVSTKLLIGFCLMIPSRIFYELEGMDENLFLGNDDLDLSWRLREKNYQLVVATDVFVYHEGQKSFETEPNEKVSRLVQESTNALYKKLISYYGGKEKVPSWETLWGMNWFNPSLSEEEEETLSPVNSGSPITTLVLYFHGDQGENLNSISQKWIEENDYPVIVIHHGTASGSMPNNIDSEKVVQLSFSASVPSQTIFKKAVNLVETPGLLFLQAGIDFSQLLKHMLSVQKSHTHFRIPVQTEEGEEAKESNSFPLAFFSQKQWALDMANKEEASFLERLHRQLKETEQASPPTLIKVSTEKPTFTKNEKMDFSSLPKSLQKTLKQGGNPGVGSTQAQGFMDLQGNPTSIENLDVIILRVYSESFDQLQSRLNALREKAKSLKQVVLLVLSPSSIAQLGPEELDKFKNTLFETEKLAWESGFKIERTDPYKGSESSEFNPANSLNSEPDTKEGYQYVCSPRTPNYNLEKKVSIIIIGFNQIEYTKKCIESIQHHTKQNYELILVDNGSNDGTAEYFNSIPNAVVIVNAENQGVAKGWNQGLRSATGDYVMVFNNDTIVTPNWLENMVRLAECHTDIGIVGPRSNNISGPQKVEQHTIKTEADILPFAQQWQQEKDLSATPFGRITGFCLLIPHKAFKKIGLFDERFGKGNFEDDDYCMRARYLGYRLLIANDSFVFHYGSVSYSHHSVDWKNLMYLNAQKFKDKWAKGESAVADTFVESTDNIKIKINTPSNSESIANMMESALDFYNLGQLEEAKAVFLQVLERDKNLSEAYNGLGIITFHEENFGDALSLFRKALELNPMDADIATNILDVIKKGSGPEEAIKCLNVLMVDFPDNPIFKKELEHQVPINKDFHSDWKQRVESLIQEKRYQEALDHIEPRLKSSQDLAACFNYMGIIAFECHDTQTAWDHFKRSLDQNLLDEDVLINYFDAGISLGKQEEVLSTFENVINNPSAIKKFAEIKHSYDQLKLKVGQMDLNPQEIISNREKNIAGENLIREGLLHKAAEIFEEIIREKPNDYRANNNLGLLAWYNGDLESAWKYFTLSLSENPTYTDALINGFDVALRIKKMDEYRNLLADFLSKDPDNIEANKIKTQMESDGEDIYNIKKFEDIDPINQKLAQAEKDLFEGKFDTSIINFLDVLEEKPHCSTAYNGLGVIAYNRKMYKDAYRLLQLAVELNPLDSTSLLNLWEVARVLGEESKVIERLSSAVQIDPSLDEVKYVVDGFSH